MKEEYSKQLEFVRHALQQQYPLGLMKHGAPVDEYDFEAQQILALVPKCTSVESLNQGIHEIFVASVGQETAGTSESYVTLAREIYGSLRVDR